jgi:hypothetical protein
MFSDTLTGQIGNILVIGLGVFTLIAGLKNVPVFADFFEKWPQLAVVVNAVAALLVAWKLCLQHTSFEFFNCVLTALGVFLSAAGIHLVKKSLTPPPRDTAEIRADVAR